MRAHRHSCIRYISSDQRGAATLAVVALLFFIVSLVAAYTNRNLIFEQRTSGNQYRSTQAFEAAEAGAQWALALLNGGRIDASCEPSADAGVTSFRDRYLAIDAATGLVQPLPNMAVGTRAWPSCVHDGSDWVCSCPDSSTPALSEPTGTGIFPAFRMRFVQRQPQRPGTVWLEVNGCTRLDNSCLDFPATGATGEGRASVQTLVALKSALPSAPVAAVTARGTVDLQGAAFGAFNPAPGSSGIALMTGGAVSNKLSLRIGGAPGAPIDPAELVRENDLALGVAAVPSGPRLFGAVFGASGANYRDQPATVRLACTALAPCDATRLRAAVIRNPGRILWAEGNVSLDGGADLGSLTAPVLLVVEGNLLLNNIAVYGLVEGRAANWALSGTTTGALRGALLAENNIVSSAAFDVVYDPAVLTQLRWRHGSFVRVPGGWRDF